MGRCSVACCGVLAVVATSACSTDGDDPDDPYVEPEPWPEPVCIDEPVPSRPFSGVVDETFPVGPYLMHTTTDSTVILWQTAEPCEASLSYGTSPDDLAEQITLTEPAHFHEVALADLAARTRYYYSVSACGQSSAVLDFDTAPEPGGALRFTVWGDSQSNPDQARATVDAMAGLLPLFDLHVGDVVGSGDEDSQWADEFLVPLRPLGHHVPTYVAIGNHERNAEMFYDVVSYPESVAADPHHESYYSFRYGNAFFLVVDTNKLFYDIDMGEAGVIETEISLWIKEQVSSDAARESVWRIALGHEPAVSESWSPGNCSYDGNVHVREWLFPLLSHNRFHVYFAGHTHTYERGMVDGVLHVITGGGGGGLDEWCRDVPETDVVQIAHHYDEVEADCETLALTSRATDTDEILDRVVLRADRWGEVSAE